MYEQTCRATYALALFAGPRTCNLPDDSLMKLKAVYSLTEQLYAGSLCIIKAVMGDKDPAKFIRDVLRRLSTIPKQIEELKRSAA